MQSIILIGDQSLDIKSVAQITHVGSKNEYLLNNERYVVEFENGRIYYDYIHDLADEYDDNELRNIPYNNPQFISMSYTSKEIMEKILLQNDFLKNIYIDNDQGCILPIEEFITKVLENKTY